MANLGWNAAKGGRAKKESKVEMRFRILSLIKVGKVRVIIRVLIWCINYWIKLF